MPLGGQLARVAVQLAVKSAAALSREAGKSLIDDDAAASNVAAAAATRTRLRNLAMRSFDAALPHVEDSPEIVHANRASTLMDLGRVQEAKAAARRALDCRGLPGSLVSFAQHTLGRAAEAAGDWGRAEAAYAEAVSAAGLAGDEASASALVRVQAAVGVKA